MTSSDEHGFIKPGMTAVVVGAGASGEAAAALLCKKGARVRLLERNANAVGPRLKAAAEAAGFTLVVGPHEVAHFAGAELVALSPGVPERVLRPLLEAAGNPPVMAEMELAFRFVDAPVLAVTGSSGKTTTATAAAAMLREAGKKVFLGGNIGTPLSAYVAAEEKADVLVLEASSFQLTGCDAFRPQAAVLLNITPNHLDWHADMREYVDAKFALFARQTPEDLAVFGPGLDDEMAARAVAARIERFSITGRFAKTPLLGAHNQANLEAAYQAAKEFGVTEDDARRAAAAFTPLAHRLELVGEWDGVAYVNDSKCTTVDAMKAALESMTRPALLLAGGVFKGGDLASLAPLLREKAKAVGLFGASREEFERAWKGCAPLSWAPTLEEAVRGLRAKAEKGDVILLAPATASFDLYENYIARGEDFKRIAAMTR